MASEADYRILDEFIGAQDPSSEVGGPQDAPASGNPQVISHPPAIGGPKQELQKLQFEDISPVDDAILNDFIGQTAGGGDVGDDSALITRTQNVQALKDQGVDVSGGSGERFRSPRTELGFQTTDEGRRLILEQEFPDGFRDTPLGPVVRIRDENNNIKEVLLDEAALTINDLADMSADSTIALSAIGGTAAVVAAIPALAAASPWVVLPTLAVVGGLSGQLGATLPEIMSNMKRGGMDLATEEGRNLIFDIVKNRGVMAAIDTAMDIMFSGGFHVGSKALNKVINPSSGANIDPFNKEIKGAAERQGVDLSTGLASGNEVIQKMEAVSSKVPGSSGIIREGLQRELDDIQAAQNRIVRDGRSVEEVGAEIKDHLKSQDQFVEEAFRTGRNIESRILDSADSSISAKISQRVDDLSASMNERALSLDEAGELARDSIKLDYLAFKRNQKELEGNVQSIIDKQMGGAFFTSVSRLKSARSKILQKIPPKLVEKEVKPPKSVSIDPVTGLRALAKKEVSEIPNVDALPPGLGKMLQLIDDLPENVSFSHLRYIRSTLNRVLEDDTLFPGIDVGTAKLLLKAVGEDMKDAISTAPTQEMKDAIGKAFNHFSANVDKYAAKPVTSALKDSTDRAFKFAGADVLPNLILSGKTEEAKAFMSATSRSSMRTYLPAVRRAVFDEIIDKAKTRTFDRGFIDADVLGKKLLEMRKSGADRIIFSESGAAEIESIAKELATRQGLPIDISEFKKTTSSSSAIDNIREMINRQEYIDKQFDKKVASVIKGTETPNFKDHEFVLKVAKLPSREFDVIWGRLDDAQKESYRKSLTMHLFDAAGKTGPAAEKVLSSVRDEIPVGNNLVDVMRSFYGKTGKESEARLSKIMGEEMFRDVRDIAILQGAVKQRDVLGSQIGQFKAGNMISQIWGGLRGGAEIMKYRVLSTLFRSKPVRDWVKRDGVTIKTPSARQQAFITVLPQIKSALLSEIGEAGTVNDIIDSLASSIGIEGPVDE